MTETPVKPTKPAPARRTSVARTAGTGRRRAARRTRPAGRPRTRRGWRATRGAFILSVVAGLFATVSLPAFASTPFGDPVAHRTGSQGTPQSLAVANSASAPTSQREGYTATSQEELDQAKAAAAAAQQAQEAAARGASALRNPNLSLTAPGAGAVRWPLPYISGYGDMFMDNGGTHDGVDMLDPAGTPIYSVAAGTVSTSSENYFGYGVAVVIEHTIGGQHVQTTYGHMTYGSRAVQAGDTVQAGQLIGQVGSTGHSTANHLHIEVRVNGSLVDPLAWLRANAS